MARDGSGNYTLPAGNPVVSGTPITASWANSTLSDIASALTNSIDKGGLTVWTANLPAGGYKITGLGAGSAAGESVRYEQVEVIGNPTVALTATATDIGANNSTLITLTGSGVSVTAFPASTVGIRRKTRFSGANTLVHSAAFYLLSQADITTAAGDVAEWVYTSSGWLMIGYSRTTGSGLLAAFPDGTVSLPGAAFAADLDNGLYRIGANNWALSAGGVKVVDLQSGLVTVPTALTVATPASATISATTPSVAVSTGAQTNLGNSGNITLATGDAQQAVGGITLTLGNGTLASGSSVGGSMTVNLGGNAQSLSGGAGSFTMSLGRYPAGASAYGAINFRLGAQGSDIKYTVARVNNQTGVWEYHTEAGTPTITSGAGSGATIVGTNHGFVLTVGTGAGASIVVTLALPASSPGTRAFAAVAGSSNTAYTTGCQTGATTLTIVTSVAPTAGDKLHVVCSFYGS